MKILALDTATEVCSVALLVQDPGAAAQLWVRELPAGPGHSAHILALVQAVLEEGTVALTGLDCLAFGRGPGGFTGVRLAASVAQGLAYGAGLAVIPVSDLLAVAQQGLDQMPAAVSVLVCNDARMQEVYWTCASRGPGGLARAATAEQVTAPDKVKLPSELLRPIAGVGRGFAVWPSLQESLRGELMQVEAELLPRAREIARLAVPAWIAGQGVTPDRAQPVYLRNDVAKPSHQ